MHESFRLGRIGGITIGANWSLLVVFGLITSSLAVSLLPEREPGHSAATYWIVATIASLLFFASLLAHELGHAAVAKRSGLAVEGITLWLFGGVARLGGDAASPRDELRIAAVGPVISIGAGVTFGIAAAVGGLLSAPDLLVAAASWLAQINVILGVFNLMPAFPLDGGRVLRAILWQRQGDPIQATVSAARLGEGFAWLLIVAGIVELAAGLPGGLWFAFLGWFLLSAARSERSAVVLRRALSGLRVQDVMTPAPVTAPAGISVAAALERLVQVRHTCLPLIDEAGAVAGLATLQRMERVPLADRATTPALRVARQRTALVRARADEPLVDVLERLSSTDDGHALVFAADALVGIVATSDVARAIELAVVR